MIGLRRARGPRSEMIGLPYAVIFDMDGVIFDTERAWITCWEPVAKRHAIPDLDRVLREDCVGITAAAMKARLLEVYGADFPYDAYRAEAYAEFDARYRHDLPVKKGAQRLLSWLHGRGVPTGLASSTGSATVKDELGQAGLIQYFDVIVGGEAVTRSKPAPDIYLLAARRLGVEPGRCFVIEDARFGIQAAHAAGMMPIMVPDLQKPDDDIRALCHSVLCDLDQVQRAFEQIL